MSAPPTAFRCAHCAARDKPRELSWAPLHHPPSFMHAVHRYGRDGLARMVLCIDHHPENAHQWLAYQEPDEKRSAPA